MQLDDLAIFAAIAEASGISAAAKRLGQPKSTVSRALARLEADLGVVLVHRSTRRVSLSSAGYELFARVGPLMRALEDSMKQLPERLEEPSGRLRVTLPLDFAVIVMSDIVARFAERYPKVSLELDLSSQFVDLVTERFDVALRISVGRLRDSSLIARPIASLATRLYASPRHLAQRAPLKRPEDLAQHRFVGLRSQQTLELMQGETRRAVKVRSSLVSGDLFFTRSLLRAGAGIGLLPAFLADDDVASGRLSGVLPRWKLPSARVWLVRPNAAEVPAKVSAFERFVIESLKARPLA